MSSQDKTGAGSRSWTVAEFFSQALAIEIEASERYGLLADQMDVHNKREIAEIFRKMAEIEGKHRDEIQRRAADARVDADLVRSSWFGPSGPEAIPFEDIHYLMSPHQALHLARRCEESAVAFYEAIATTALDPQVRRFAEEMAGDERHHVAWLDQWLKRFPPPEPGWDEDPDPPIYSE
jgi:rubrerythrin